MVPKVRIELTADPYQGPVLPLNYIGILLKYNIVYLFIIYIYDIIKNIGMVFL